MLNGTAVEDFLILVVIYMINHISHRDYHSITESGHIDLHNPRENSAKE